jgi:hypothetical protein
MNNKKILGIPITLFVIGLIAIAGASAALVTFLSNTTTSTYNVDSPFVLQNAQGHLEPVSVTNGDNEDLEYETEIDFGDLIGTSEIQWTNYIKSNSEVDIPVIDYEMITGQDDSGNPLTMDEIDDQYSFFGARYWRPQGSDYRLVDYAGDIELGWDPYTLDTNGVITCYGNEPSGPYGADISGSSYVDIRDNICYYVEAAFDFDIVGDDLVSDYAYTYIAGTEELAQYTAVLEAATTPGTYNYMRQINIQPI